MLRFLCFPWAGWAAGYAANAAILPPHLHCGRMGRYQTTHEAARVWRRLGSDSNMRADVTCCSLDKISSVLEYATLVLDFKVNTMRQQTLFAKDIEEGLGRSKSESPCQPLMQGRFSDRLKALQQTALPLGLEGIGLQRQVVRLTLRLGMGIYGYIWVSWVSSVSFMFS